jgi:hypothetical protein
MAQPVLLHSTSYPESELSEGSPVALGAWEMLNSPQHLAYIKDKSKGPSEEILHISN